ncbi:MAG: Transcriptional regulator, MarR family, partial [uncultured Corynebacteriales bacterium]
VVPLPSPRGQAAGPAVRPDRAGRGDLGAHLGPGVGDAGRDLGHAGAADPARALRRGAPAARADLRPVRGTGAAAVQPQRRVAAEGDRQPAHGPPDQRHQRDRPTGRRRPGGAGGQPGGPARRAGPDHRARPGGRGGRDRGPDGHRLRAGRAGRGGPGRRVRRAAGGPGRGRRLPGPARL